MIAGVALIAMLLAAAIYARASQLPRNVVIVADTDRPVVDLMIVLPYPSGQGPLAHYTEHLAWLNAVGGAARAADRHSNAWTNAHAVGYWLSGDPADLPDLVQTLARVFDPLDLPVSFAMEEREIILREYDFRMAGNPDAQAEVSMDAFLYEGNGLAASLIGTPGQIMALDYDAARAFHAATHRPELATLIITGDVSAPMVRRALRDAGWTETDPGRAPAPARFILGETVETSLRFPVATATPRLIWRRVIALPEPVQFDLLEARTALVEEILNTSLPGGLGGPLQSEAMIARSFDVQIWPLDEKHIEIVFRAAPDKDVSLLALQQAFASALSDSAAGVPSATFDRVLARFSGFWPDWSDDAQTADWMASYVRDRAVALRAPLPVSDLARLDRRLSLQSTNTLLRQLAGPGRSAVALIGPEGSFE